MGALYDTFGAREGDILSHSRSEPIASIRLMLIRVLVDKEWNLDDIGPAMNRTRTLAWSRLRDHDLRMEEGVDKRYKESYEALIEELNK